jgi:hypothetical protein
MVSVGEVLMKINRQRLIFFHDRVMKPFIQNVESIYEHYSGLSLKTDSGISLIGRNFLIKCVMNPDVSGISHQGSSIYSVNYEQLIIFLQGFLLNLELTYLYLRKEDVVTAYGKIETLVKNIEKELDPVGDIGEI